MTTLNFLCAFPINKLVCRALSFVGFKKKKKKLLGTPKKLEKMIYKLITSFFFQTN